MRNFDHRVVLRETGFKWRNASDEVSKGSIYEVYDALISDDRRNRMVLSGILDSIAAGRSPLVITERREHLEYFAKELISWRGTLAQYACRLHREHENKTEVLIYDYTDSEIPMVARMRDRHMRGYRALGHRIEPKPG